MDSAAPESVYGNQNNLSLLQFGDVSNLKTLYCAENHLAWTESGKALDLQLSPQTIELKRKYDGEKYWTDLNEVLTPQQLQRTEVLMGENSQIASFDKESGKVFYTGPASALEYYFTAGDVGEDEGNARMLVQAKLTEETVTPPQEEKFHVTIKANDNSMGTVTIDSADGSYKKGEKAEVIAVANEGFRFVNWTDAEGNVISESNPYVFEVTKNTELIGEFKAVEVPHVPSAQEILNDILANNKIPSEVKAGTERLVLPEVPEGSKIEIVAVNPEGIIGLDGKVTTPENDTDVIVTIQVTDTNGATAKADVKVLVRGEKADPDDDNNGNDNNGGNDNNSGNNNGGSHNNGSTSGSHSQSVQTGDNANVIVWAVLLVAAVAAVGAVVVIRRKKK